MTLRLRSAADFERVRRDGRSHAHPLVVLITCRQPDGALPGPARLAVVAGRAVGGATRRNRAKRLLREAARRRAGELADGWDLILIARRPLAETKLAQAAAAVDSLLKKANVIRTLGA